MALLITVLLVLLGTICVLSLLLAAVAAPGQLGGADSEILLAYFIQMLYRSERTLSFSESSRVRKERTGESNTDKVSRRPEGWVWPSYSS